MLKFKKALTLIFMVSLFTCLFFTGAAAAGDLDDGISKYTDDGIGKYDDLGKDQPNIKYVIQSAKSQANVRKKAAERGIEQGGNSSGSTSGSGDNNMNSVVMGAGSVVRGDIYIIDQSKGDKTQVAE